jgi:uncharacterized protein (TIGR02996 family)
MADDIIRSFLHKMDEEPDEAMHRLVLADWLDEHDQPHRAELIRLHTEMARLKRRDPSRAALAEREEQLCTEHRSAFLGSLEQLPPTWQIDIGTYGQLAGNVKVEHLPWVHQEAQEGVWLRRLRVHGRMDVAAILAPLASPNLASLTQLVLFNNGLGDAGARTLAQAPLLARLTALSLRCNEIGSAGLAALASSPYLTRLTHLDLDGNDIGPEGVLALVGSSHLGRLRSLSLAFNPIGDAGARALASSKKLSSLKELVLGGFPRFTQQTDQALRQRFGAGLDLGGR